MATAGKPSLECSICGKKIKNAAGMYSHYRIVHGKTYDEFRTDMDERGIRIPNSLYRPAGDPEAKAYEARANGIDYQADESEESEQEPEQESELEQDQQDQSRDQSDEPSSGFPDEEEDPKTLPPVASRPKYVNVGIPASANKGLKPKWARRCPLCDDVVTSTNVALHFVNRHPGRSPKEFRESNVYENTGRQVVPGRAFEDAAILAITPRRFEASSTLIWQAKYVTEKEWGWKHTESIGDWLDTFIWYCMKKFGVTLLGYTVERPIVRSPKPVLRTAVSASVNIPPEARNGS